jgi:hypothetical protein
MSDFLAGGSTWEPGNQVRRRGFTAEVRKVSCRRMPSEVAFHFDQPLESEGMTWLYFDWGSLRFTPFELPQEGKRIEIAGPKPLKWFANLQ